MAIEIKLPNLGENVESGDVLSILVSEGEVVQAEQGVLELETDKATMEVPTPKGGKVTKIHVSEGDTVPVGTVILTLEEVEANGASAPPKAAPPEQQAPAEEAPPAQQAAPAPKQAPAEKAAPPAAQPAAPAKPAPQPTTELVDAVKSPANRPAPAPAQPKAPATPEEDLPGDGQSSAAAGPAVRRLARQLGVDLRRVRASGEGGRITQDDVLSYVRESNLKAASRPASGPTPPGNLSVDAYGSVRREKMSRMRRTIAQNMLHSYTTIPQLTNFDDADVTELEKIRQESKDDYARNGIKLTTMPFLIKAIASALKHHPVMNASIAEDGEHLIYKEYVNVGIAVDTDRGLLVPVMRDVDRMNIPQIARGLAELSEKARSGDFTVEDLRGGTFTISNLGAIGGTYSTPIINPPEVAILLAGRTRKMPVFLGEQVVGRLMMPLSITYDHRVVDGAAAARFLNDVKGFLSAPGRLLLAP